MYRHASSSPDIELLITPTLSVLPRKWRPRDKTLRKFLSLTEEIGGCIYWKQKTDVYSYPMKAFTKEQFHFGGKRHSPKTLMCCWYRGSVPSKTPSENYGRLTYGRSCKNKKCIHPYHIWIDRHERINSDTTSTMRCPPPPYPPPLPNTVPQPDPSFSLARNYCKEDDDAMESECDYDTSTSLSSPCGSPCEEFNSPNS